MDSNRLGTSEYLATLGAFLWSGRWYFRKYFRRWWHLDNTIVRKIKEDIGFLLTL